MSAVLLIACIGIAVFFLNGFASGRPTLIDSLASLSGLKASEAPYIPGTQVPLEEPPAEDPNAPRIYLTFDDGPSETSTQQILEILKANDIHATFFVVGYKAERYPDLILQEASEGHVIANHTYCHDYAVVYVSPDAFIDDVQNCERVLTGILGKTPEHILRFPAGTIAVELDGNPEMRDSIKEYLSENGWRYFDWNASFGDSRLTAPEPGKLANNLNAYIDDLVENGTTDIVVLGHDDDAKPWTPADLPLVIEHCKEKGYVFKVLTLDSPPCAFR